MLPRIIVPLVAFALLAAACNQGPTAASTAASASPTAAQTAPATASSSIFGAPITSKNALLLADLARDPVKWQGQDVVVTGNVADVCQHMGCWMVIEDGAQKARVRMHGHSFFVPKDCKGRRARVQGQAVVSAAPPQQHECNHAKQEGEHHECPKDQPGELSFDATGVELL
jgi:hypothetical protein